MSRSREIALAAAAAILFGGAIITALDWQRPTAMFPMVIGAAGLGLAIWAIIKDLRTKEIAAPDAEGMSDADRRQARGSFIWIGVFFAAVLLIGFEWGIGLAALVFYRLEARLGWAAAILSAAACGGFLYAAAHFLSVPLYAGLIAGLIR